MRIRLDIAYDGTHFRGWAKQPGMRTVQGALEAALQRVLGGEPTLVVAGRTDAGVHATGQVAHLDLDAEQQDRLRAQRGARPGAGASSDEGSPIPGRSPGAGALAARLRGVVGAYSDVTVTRTAVAPEGFDARFAAVWRRYSYRVADAASGYDPLERHRTTTVRPLLNAEAMNEAATTLIGLHDFAAYCKPRPGATTIRTLLQYEWRRDAGGVLIATVKADAFCHSMVRALVGACVAVGSGRLDVADVVRLRDDVTRTSEFAVLAARGLTLTEVRYPSDDLLATRAEQTRGKRTLE